MNISFDEETLKEHSKEDRKYIDELFSHKKWILLELVKHSHNFNMRIRLQNHLECLDKHIVSEKREFYKNYGETYIIPSN